VASGIVKVLTAGAAIAVRKRPEKAYAVSLFAQFRRTPLEMQKVGPIGSAARLFANPTCSSKASASSRVLGNECQYSSVMELY